MSTPSYTLENGHLVVEGLSLSDQPGAPQLPVHYEVVALPDTGSWTVAFTARDTKSIALDGTSIPSVPVPVAPEPSIEASDTLPQMDFLEVVERPDPTIYEQDGLYPTQPLVTGEELWQRGERFVVVQVFPFQYNPVQNHLLYHPVIDVTVTIDGVTGETLRGTTDDVSRNPGMEPVGGSGDGVRVYTGRPGIHRITYADLQSAGAPVDSLNPQTFNMSVLGAPVAIQVVGDADGSFDPGDEVIFYAQPYEGRYMTENVYWLRYNGAAGPRMATRAAPLNTALTPVDQYQASVHIETNALYKSDLVRPKDADHWYDSPLYIQPSTPLRTRTYNFTLHAPVLDPGRTGTLFSLLVNIRNKGGCG